VGFGPETDSSQESRGDSTGSDVSSSDSLSYQTLTGESACDSVSVSVAISESSALSQSAPIAPSSVVSISSDFTASRSVEISSFFTGSTAIPEFDPETESSRESEEDSTASGISPLDSLSSATRRAGSVPDSASLISLLTPSELSSGLNGESSLSARSSLSGFPEISLSEAFAASAELSHSDVIATSDSQSTSSYFGDSVFLGASPLWTQSCLVSASSSANFLSGHFEPSWVFAASASIVSQQSGTESTSSHSPLSLPAESAVDDSPSTQTIVTGDKQSSFPHSLAGSGSLETVNSASRQPTAGRLSQLFSDSVVFSESNPPVVAPNAPARNAEGTGAVALGLGIGLSLLVLVLATAAGVWYLLAARREEEEAYSVEVEEEMQTQTSDLTGIYSDDVPAVTESQSSDDRLGEVGFEEAVFPVF
jgi:hypothetical protein